MEIRAWRFQNYRDCGYTCNPHKFEIPALWFLLRVPAIPCKHLQCRRNQIQVTQGLIPGQIISRANSWVIWKNTNEIIELNTDWPKLPNCVERLFLYNFEVIYLIRFRLKLILWWLSYQFDTGNKFLVLEYIFESRVLAWQLQSNLS